MNDNQTSFFLYFTLGCHLCDDAEAVIKPVAGHLHQSFEKVDIADNDILVELYGMRIPVLYHCASGAELGWPFDGEMVFNFMRQQCQLS